MAPKDQQATCFECERNGCLRLAHYKAKIKLQYMKEKITVFLCKDHILEHPNEVINDAEKIHKNAVNLRELVLQREYKSNKR